MKKKDFSQMMLHKKVNAQIITVSPKVCARTTSNGVVFKYLSKMLKLGFYLTFVFSMDPFYSVFPDSCK